MRLEPALFSHSQLGSAPENARLPQPIKPVSLVKVKQVNALESGGAHGSAEEG